jgi:hypothetical protein
MTNIEVYGVQGQVTKYELFSWLRAPLSAAVPAHNIQNIQIPSIA